MSNAGANREESNHRNPSIQSSNQPKMQFQINKTGNTTKCNFYVPDATGDNTAMAFRAAYSYGQSSMSVIITEKDNELCACVGSMLCAVVPAFRDSVETALNGSGIRPRFVRLPSKAKAHGIIDSELNQLDWASILSVFGYCILTIFKIDRGEFGLLQSANASEIIPDDIYEILEEATSPNDHRIFELRAKVGCSPNNSLYRIPFKVSTENVIRTMLGTRALRTAIINFLLSNSDDSDPQISSLCQYLIEVLSWSGDMRVFTLMNDRLVKTNSPVLTDSRVIAEVENFEKLRNAVTSQRYPKFFNHMCSTSELLYLDVSRFPTLYTVAQLLEKGKDDVFYYDVSSRANEKIVLELLKLHRTALKHN